MIKTLAHPVWGSEQPGLWGSIQLQELHPTDVEKIPGEELC